MAILGRYDAASFTSATGVQVAANATVEVRRQDTNAIATLFSDIGGLVPFAANPFLADSEGRFFFYAAGIDLGYKVTVTIGAVSYSLENQAVSNSQYLDRDALPYTPVDADLTAIAALATLGIAVRSAANTWVTRSIVGTTNRITVTNPAGTIGDMTLNAPQDIHTGATPAFAQVALAADPTTALQAATKQYVDNLAAGFDVKPSCRLATTANDTRSGLAARDGVTPSANDRVLVKNQSAPAENGVFVAAAGAWTRATDMGAWTEVPAAFVFVEEGTVNGDTGWVCTANAGGTLNTTAITWSQFSGVGAFQPLSANLTAIAGLTTSADKISYWTGAGAAAVSDITAGMRAIFALAGAADRLAYYTAAGTAALAVYTAQARTFDAAVDQAAQRVVLALTPGTDVSALIGANSMLESIQFAASDENTALTSGVAKVTIRMPYAFTLSTARASLSTAQTSGLIFTVDINQNGSSIISTKLTIDNTEKTSATAATPPVISNSALTDDSEITIDVDQVGDGTAKGLKIALIGKRA